MSADDETVGAIAGLYLGNILYALETTAMTFDQDGKPDHAAFYRGLARKLAEARGREKESQPGVQSPDSAG